MLRCGVIRTRACLCALFLLLAASACGGSSGSGANHGPATGSTPGTLVPAASPAPLPCTSARPHASGDFDESIDSGGLTRTYILHVPPAYDGASAMPLVLSFHAFGSDAKFMAGYTKSGAIADAQGAIVVTPNGQGHPQFWNVRGAGVDVDDVAFARELLVKLDAVLCIDASRTYADGYSNGGGMALLLACAMPHRIAAVGVVAATYVQCDADVPLIAFHGIADPVVTFEGADYPPEEGGGSYPPIRRSVSDWAHTQGCAGLPTISRPASDVELSTYHACHQGDGAALLYSIIGGGHTWPGAVDLTVASAGATNHQIDAMALIWAFFAAHPRTRGP